MRLVGRVCPRAVKTDLWIAAPRARRASARAVGIHREDRRPSSPGPGRRDRGQGAGTFSYFADFTSASVLPARPKLIRGT